MSLLLKEDDDICGIMLPNSKCIKITQYADDTCVYLKDFNQIPKCIAAINRFSQVSGLKLNIEKTEGLCLGTLQNTNNQTYNIKWPKEPIRYLGIYIGNDTNQCNHKNWTTKLEKTQKLIDSWHTRKLTLYGKVLIIKSLVLPKIVYSASLLPCLDGSIKTLNKMLFQFIWGNRDRLKRNVMINTYQNGGLQMLDVESHFMALKAAWIPRIYGKSDDIWRTLPRYYIDKATCGLLPKMSASSLDELPHLTILPDFYKEVIIGYTKSKCPPNIESKIDLFNQVLWGNRHLKANGKCLFSKSFINAKIYCVSDILNQDGTINENVYHALKDKHNYFKIMSLIQISLRPYKLFRFHRDSALTNKPTPTTIKDTKCKHFYSELVKQKRKRNTYINKWSQMFNVELTFPVLYENKLKHNFEIKITDFNFKLINGLLATGQNLFKWKKRQSGNCIYCDCNHHDEHHLLYACPDTHMIWKHLSNILKVNLDFLKIVTGISIDTNDSQIVSLLCFLIYKKFFRDINNNNIIPLNVYIKKELQICLHIYRNLETSSSVNIIKSLIDLL